MRGFTLLELLVVFSILAVLMGLGVGVFSQVHFERYAVLGVVRNVLRGAREAATSSGLPVTVVCDAATKRVYDLTVQPVGHWSFEEGPASASATPAAVGAESESVGAFDLIAKLHGASVGPPGRVGNALWFTRPGELGEVTIGEAPAWRFSSGVAVELDLWSDRDQAALLVKRGKQFRLSIAGDGSVEGQVGVAFGERDEGKTAGTLVVTSAKGLVVAQRWTRIGFVYDRVALTLLVDGLPVATKESHEQVIRDLSPLEMGDRAGTFRGALDSVKVGAVRAGEGEPLSKDVAFGFKGPRLEVHFSADGRLDPSYHRAAVSVPFLFGGVSQREITVGPYGTVR